MPDSAPNPTDAPSTEPATPAAQPTATPEIDWKAEARKWETRAKENKDAADALAALQAQVATDKQQYEQQISDLTKTGTDTAATLARYKVAVEKSVPVDLLPAGADEQTLATFADNLIAFRGPDRHVVPGVGNTPPKPPTAAEVVRAAEQSGDVKASLAAKTGLLAQLAAGQSS